LLDRPSAIGDWQGPAARLRSADPIQEALKVATASTYANPGPLARWRARDAAVEARTSAAYAAEGVGTFLLVFFICAVVSVGNADTLQLDIAGLGLLHALILMVLVYALGATSGAHLNPAVTIGLVAIHGIRARDAGRYIACQLAGGVLAGLLVLALFHGVGAGVNYGATAISSKVVPHGSPWLGVIDEALGTFLLMWAVMAVAINPRGEAHVAGVAVGGALGLAVMVFGPATGAGLNPARWLGPALASGTYGDFWIYLVGPVFGAIAAAFGYRRLVLDRTA
jgi:MIP family channel proteins